MKILINFNRFGLLLFLVFGGLYINLLIISGLIWGLLLVVVMVVVVMGKSVFVVEGYWLNDFFINVVLNLILLENSSGVDLLVFG